MQRMHYCSYCLSSIALHANLQFVDHSVWNTEHLFWLLGLPQILAAGILRTMMSLKTYCESSSKYLCPLLVKPLYSWNTCSVIDCLNDCLNNCWQPDWVTDWLTDRFNAMLLESERVYRICEGNNDSEIFIYIVRNRNFSKRVKNK